MLEKENPRKAIPKRIRFEVFKRDSFKCQYCGAEAPSVILQVDHIVPVSKGGKNDISNLITSCCSCNSGKSDKLLDEDAVVTKERRQNEELQERREQIEMMFRWKKGLKDLKEKEIDRLCQYWERMTPEWSVNENGKQRLRNWLREYSIESIIFAMEVAACKYLRFDEEGKCESDSWDEAFSKIPAICNVKKQSEEYPEIKDLYIIRGILNNRLKDHYFDKNRAIEWLRAAHSWGVEIIELKEIAFRARNWSNFSDLIDEAIDRMKRMEEVTDES